MTSEEKIELLEIKIFRLEHVIKTLVSGTRDLSKISSLDRSVLNDIQEILKSSD